MDYARISRKGLVVALTLFLALTASAFGNHSEETAAAEQQNKFSFYKPSSETTYYPPVKNTQVRNVVLFIGDGMGFGPVALARMEAAGPDARLYMERMPVAAFVRTHSADAVVTDSAAAATALATGCKTNNGMVSLSPEGKKYLTILEAAKNKGMATGLVATSTITHATPACFAAHNKSRNNQPQIAEDLLANKVNIILGGGREYFLPKTNTNSKRTDQKDLIDQAKKAGYLYIQTPEQLSSAQGPYLLGLFQDGALTTEGPEPALAELTEKAIEILSRKKKGLFQKKKSFFLMVEGSQIDWACHGNDAANTVRQTLLFDQAVKAALDFAAKDKHTLVVVTADHDTGGLVIKAAETQGKPELSWSTKSHTALPVPLFAYGPGAELFCGVYDNTDVPKKIAKSLGIKSFPKILE